jgi:hypothetical protein
MQLQQFCTGNPPLIPIVIGQRAILLIDFPPKEVSLTLQYLYAREKQHKPSRLIGMRPCGSPNAFTFYLSLRRIDTTG